MAGITPAVRGTRNYKSSWDKSDSSGLGEPANIRTVNVLDPIDIGPKDKKFLQNLVCSGKSSRAHCKFLRQIQVWMDITAPRFWWQEWDTYKIGTNAQSTSTMNTLLDDDKVFSLDDFSLGDNCSHTVLFIDICDRLNEIKGFYKNAADAEERNYWREEAKRLLPESFNQMRSVNVNFEVLSNMYRDRYNHKLPEWRYFCDRVELFPYSWLITGRTIANPEILIQDSSMIDVWDVL